MPTERQMRIANLGAFPLLAREFGADPGRLLERHDIDPLSLRNPDQFIDVQSYTGLLEDCSSLFNEPLFGLQLAQMQEPDVYGCVIALCRASATLRDALACLIKFLPITHSPAAMPELVVCGETAFFRWGVCRASGASKQAHFQSALLNLKLLCQLGGRSFQPLCVNLAVDIRDKDVDVLERMLRCRFHSHLTENSIGFPAVMLDQPVPSANQIIVKLLGGYLDRVKDAARLRLEDRVQDYIRFSLSDGNCSIERCAAKMNISVRTLQARLKDSRLSFSDILEEQRIALAENYLKQSRYSLDDVAANLGYSEQSSFGRAFKRWTGQTPNQYRHKIYMN